MTAILRYSEPQFHNLLWAIAKKPHKLKKMPAFVEQLLKNYEGYIRSVDLAYIDKITLYLKKKNDPLYEKVRDLYNCHRATYTPFLQLPGELVRRLAEDLPTYLALRRVCRPFSETMPIQFGALHLLQEKEFIQNVSCFATILLTLIKRDKIEEAHYCLRELLRTAPPETQKVFWQQFESYHFDILDVLFKQTFRQVTSLNLATDQLNYFKKNQTWITFFSSLIQVCPDLTRLSISMPCKGEFPTDFLNAIMASKGLQVLDISSFALVNPYETLLALSKHPALNEIYVQIPFCEELLDDLPLDFYPKLKGLALRPLAECQTKESLPQTDEKTELTFFDDPRSSALIERCKLLRRVRIMSPEMLQAITPQVEELELILPASDRKRRLIQPLAQAASKLEAVHTLSIFRHINSPPARLQEMTPILEKLPNLVSLQTCLLSPSVQRRERHWLDTLCRAKKLKSLTCELRHRQYEFDKLATLSQTLESLNVFMDLSEEYEPVSTELNRASKLFRLVVEVSLPKKRHDFDTILDGLLNVCNPKELVLIGFFNQRSRKFIHPISIVKSGHFWVYQISVKFLLKYSRMERVVFHHDGNWQTEVKGLQVVQETHPLGYSLSGASLDLTSFRKEKA